MKLITVDIPIVQFATFLVTELNSISYSAKDKTIMYVQDFDSDNSKMYAEVLLYPINDEDMHITEFFTRVMHPSVPRTINTNELNIVIHNEYGNDKLPSRDSDEVVHEFCKIYTTLIEFMETHKESAIHTTIPIMGDMTMGDSIVSDPKSPKCASCESDSKEEFIKEGDTVMPIPGAITFEENPVFENGCLSPIDDAEADNPETIEHIMKAIAELDKEDQDSHEDQ